MWPRVGGVRVIWIEVVAAAAGGFAAGWGAHYFLRRADRAAPPDPAVGSPVPAPAATAPEMENIAAIRGTAPAAELPRAISLGASTAGRIVVHLSTLGRLMDDEVARMGFTQAGIMDALGLRQGTLAKALARLEAAEIVRSDRRHVTGMPRRLKVYRLTPLGDSLAKSLRRRGAPERPPSRP